MNKNPTARARKKNPVVPAEPGPPDAQIPTATEKVTRITTYSQRVPIPAEPPPVAAEEAEDELELAAPDEPEFEDEDEPPLPPLKAWQRLGLPEIPAGLSDFEKYEFVKDVILERPDLFWLAIVFRLPEYANVTSPHYRRWDTAVRSSCGQLNATGEFIEEVRQRFARTGQSNAFCFTIKANGHVYTNIGVLIIEPLETQTLAAEARRETPPSAWAVQPPDSLTSVRDAIKLAREMTGLAAALPPPPAPVAAPAPELTMESALVKIIASDREMVSQAVGRLLGREHPAPAAAAGGGSFWNDMLLELARSHEIQQMLARLIGGLGGMAVSNFAVTSPPAEPPSAPEVPSPPPAIAPEAAMLNFLLDACANQYNPQQTAEALINLQSRKPEVEVYLDGFLNLPPEIALVVLSQHLPEAQQITSQPHVAAWTQAVQEHLTDESKTDEEAVPAAPGA